jgi:hypothetical protein
MAHVQCHCLVCVIAITVSNRNHRIDEMHELRGGTGFHPHGNNAAKAKQRAK